MTGSAPVSSPVLDLEITMRRSGAGGPYRVSVASPTRAFAVISEYLANCWGTPVPRDINADVIAWQLGDKGEYRRDHEQYLIVVKEGSA